MTIYLITRFDADDSPHAEAALVQAGSEDEAKALLYDALGDEDDRPETVWGVAPLDQWRVVPAEGPILYLLGGGCR
jgi:hypothetical protein